MKVHNTDIMAQAVDPKVIQVSENIRHLILQEQLLFKVALLVLFIASLIILFISAHKYRKNNWRSEHFIWLCIFVCMWAGCMLLRLYAETTEAETTFRILSDIAWVYIPACLLLHVWKQVSFIPVTTSTYMGAFIVPMAFGGLMIFHLLAVPYHPSFEKTMQTVFFFTTIGVNIYNIAALIRSYLFCFNVFYQMPRHMRRSTRYMLGGISMFVLYFILYQYLFADLNSEYFMGMLNTVFLPPLQPLLLLIMVYLFYSAFFFAPSDNVIATSREFVFGNLTTTVFVLSKDYRILDWNKKGMHTIYPLPTPLYREPFGEYKDRMMQENSGRISPHVDNVMLTMRNGEESHYLFTTHDIEYGGRHFGYLAEISKITNVYSILRSLEDSAIIDQLTGLYNRNAYIDRVPTIVKQNNLPLAILVGDINNLKRVNDTEGHIVGDALITHVAGVIRSAIPSTAFAARIGGDEFVIMLPNSSEEYAQKVITEITEKNDLTYDPSFGTPSVSWGYSLYTSTDMEYNDAFAEADQMMYKHKKEHYQFRSSGFVPDEKDE